MCDCRYRIEDKLLDRFVEASPEAKEHSVNLTGYLLVFGDTVQAKGCMSAEQTAKFPLKKGGFKERKGKINVAFTFCPFCGEKYE